MSKQTKSTEYGKVAMAINVPYIIRGISCSYDKAVSLNADYNTNTMHGENNNEEINQEIEKCLDEMEAKSAVLDKYMERYNIDLGAFKESRYYQFYQRDMHDFISAYRQILTNRKEEVMA